MGVPATNTTSVRSGVSQSILDTFWDLADAKDDVRLNAAERLILLLREHQPHDDDDQLSQGLQYVLKRLIAGLTSSRKFARPGYSMALAEVIHSFSVPADYVVEQIRSTLKVSKKDSKREQGHARLAQALAYLAIMQAGQIPKAPGKTVQAIAESVSKLRSEKQYLHLLGVQTLSTLIKSAKPKKFLKFILPAVAADLQVGWGQCTADSLLLLATVRRYHKEAFSDDQLQEHWGCSNILSSVTISHIANILAQTVTYHPQVHPLCLEMVNIALKEASSKIFARFWKQAITEKLIQAEQAQKRYLGLQLVSHALSQGPSRDAVEQIMNTALIDLLLRCVVHKSDVLYNAGKQLLLKIVDYCSKETQGGIQLIVLKQFLKPPSSIMFDCISETKTVANIVHSLTADACFEYTRELMKVVLKEGDFCSGKDDLSVCKWAGSQLVAVLAVPSISSNVEWQSSVLQFLLLHSFFKLTKSIPDVKHCEKVSALDLEKSKALRDMFYKALNTLASCYPDKKHSKHEYVGILFNVMSYANQLLMRSSEGVKPIVSLPKEVKDTWIKTVSFVEELHRQIVPGLTEDKVSKNRAFAMLFMLFGLHLLLPDTKETVETLKELEVCYEKSKKRGKPKTANEPEWIEVITELLVSFMSKSSHLLRSVSSSVFAFLQAFMTKQALDVILEVFTATGGGDGEPVDFEDDDNMDDEGSSCQQSMEDAANTNGDENDHDGDENESGSDEGDTDSSDESVYDGDVDPELRSAVRKALGKAAVAAEEATPADEDANMSDSEMFRLDDALAAAFRSMKRHGQVEKERSKQLLHFKLRCMDLLEMLVKEGARTDLMIELLVPLISLIDAGAKDKEQKILGDKATNLYHKLCKLKKVKGMPTEVKSALPEKLKEMIDLTSHVSGVPVALAVCNGCQFLLRAALAREDDASPAAALEHGSDSTVSSLLEVVKESLHLFLTHRESRLSHFVFQHMFERHPDMFWPMHRLLLDCAVSAEVRIFCRTQAWALLTLLLQKNVISVVGHSQWAAFVSAVQEVIKKAVYEMSHVDNFKPRYVQELCSAVVKVLAVDPSLTFDIAALENARSLFTKPIKKLYAKLKSHVVGSVSISENGDAGSTKRTIGSSRGGDADGEVDTVDLKPPKRKKLSN